MLLQPAERPEHDPKRAAVAFCDRSKSQYNGFIGVKSRLHSLTHGKRPTLNECNRLFSSTKVTDYNVVLHKRAMHV